MPILKPIGESYTKRKIEISKRNGWRYAIFSSRTKQFIAGYYKGEWRNDKKEGKGNEINRNGWVYEGDWFDGKRHGYGVLSKISENGILRQRYAGEWVAGKRNGFGYSWYKDSSYYEGDFCQNKRHGCGRIWYCNGDYYEGTWRNDLYDGVGMFVKVNGNRYEGQFVEGKKEGYGTFYHIVTGQEQCGFWSNDSCISGTMSDMYWRQSAPRPTPYPIPWNELAENDGEIKIAYENSDDNENTESVYYESACKKPTKRIIANVCVPVNTCPCLDSVL
ncbi:MORN repeat-containing protein 3-like isoform X1 [Hylaeus anthracinus]|uniref:MORN repeat-containing protein 3-like isoform X1 n=1 Tax=Hylaeus anthracinus TaxID=313031 RepID=UPI0023B9B37E|nr:MORN repeat-containing protein 3-like isoform X1 [Hylaeus anthracinus]